ncbi:hypothetical protein [Pseudomonas sp. RA_5y_Pfl1_P24]|uniref:hypothetical protein n=1 Tax=Pseudomonas sp. RA_5y_Pfl1_P24 TaxID=3088706 RepID=UPI0030DBA8DF
MGTEPYSTLQKDIFYSAMGVMTANSVALKDTPPKPGGSDPVLYIARTTATTAALAAGNTLKAFTTLDEIKTSTTKNTKKYAFLGAFLGLILGSVFVLGRFFIRQYKQSN